MSALSRSPFYKALELWLYTPLFLLLQCEHVSGWPMGQITAFDSSFRVEIQTRMVAVEICCHLVKIFWPAWEESLISELSSIRSGHITKKRKVTTAANHTKAQTQGVIYHTLFHFPLSVKLSRKLKIFTMENSSANEEKIFVQSFVWKQAVNFLKHLFCRKNCLSEKLGFFFTEKYFDTHFSVGS